MTNIKVKKLHKDAIIPKRAHASDAGFDIYALEDMVIEPGETALVKTGLAFELPEGYEMQIRPRSGITLKTKLRVQIGTVDAGYRAEVGVIVDNSHIPKLNYRVTELLLVDNSSTRTEVALVRTHSYGRRVYYEEGHRKVVDGTYLIRKGDRIAQAIIQRLPDVNLIEVDSLGDSERGAGGFGSTGVSSDEKKWKEAFDEMVERAKRGD